MSKYPFPEETKTGDCDRCDAKNVLVTKCFEFDREVGTVTDWACTDCLQDGDHLAAETARAESQDNEIED